MNSADTVMLIDAAYLDRVGADLSKHFSGVLGRELPKGDLALLLECLAMDGGTPFGDNTIHVFFVCDDKGKKLESFRPGDLKKELDCMAFKSRLGEFVLYSFEPSDMATREELFLEGVKLAADAKEVKRLVVVPFEEAYGGKIPAILDKVDGKEKMTVFGMNPLAGEGSWQWEMLGFSILLSFGIKADEL